MTVAEPPATAPTTAVVRPMAAADLAFAAALHEKALPHGFFGRLGTRFLKAYYETFSASPHAVALVAQTPAGRAGVLVGTWGPHYTWVLRNRWGTLALRGLFALLTRPREFRFFLRTRTGRYTRALLRLVKRRSQVRSADTPADTPPAPAVLTHVAVAEGTRGQGVGQGLVDAFLAAAREAGCHEASLVTLQGPDGAGHFYRRLGWTLTAERADFDGRMVECFCRRL